MQRRDFLKVLVVAAGASGAGVFAHNIYDLNSENGQRNWLKSQLEISPTIAEIGNDYINKNSKQNAESIEKFFQKMLGDGTNLSSVSLTEKLKKQIDDDYKNMNIFEASGWVISDAEAKLAAFLVMES